MKKGFTIVEIIISIGLIVLIGTMSVVSFNFIKKGNKQDEYLKIVNPAIHLYYNNNKEILKQKIEQNGLSYIKTSQLVEDGLLDENLVKNIINQCYEISYDNEYLLNIKTTDDSCIDLPIIKVPKIDEGVDINVDLSNENLCYRTEDMPLININVDFNEENIEFNKFIIYDGKEEIIYSQNIPQSYQVKNGDNNLKFTFNYTIKSTGEEKSTVWKYNKNFFENKGVSTLDVVLNQIEVTNGNTLKKIEISKDQINYENLSGSTQTELLDNLNNKISSEIKNIKITDVCNNVRIYRLDGENNNNVIAKQAFISNKHNYNYHYHYILKDNKLIYTQVNTNSDYQHTKLNIFDIKNFGEYALFTYSTKQMITNVKLENTNSDDKDIYIYVKIVNNSGRVGNSYNANYNEILTKYKYEYDNDKIGKIIKIEEIQGNYEGAVIGSTKKNFCRITGNYQVIKYDEDGKQTSQIKNFNYDSYAEAVGVNSNGSACFNDAHLKEARKKKTTEYQQIENHFANLPSMDVIQTNDVGNFSESSICTGDQNPFDMSKTMFDGTILDSKKFNFQNFNVFVCYGRDMSGANVAPVFLKVNNGVNYKLTVIE